MTSNGLEKHEKMAEFLKNAMKRKEDTHDEVPIYVFNDEYLKNLLDNFWDDSMRHTLFDSKFEVYDYHYEWMNDYLNSWFNLFDWDLDGWEEFATQEVIDGIHDEIMEELEADIYTSDLLKWYASRITNPAIMDEALETLGATELETYNAFERLQIAQSYAIGEIYEIGRTIIHNIVERIDDKV